MKYGFFDYKYNIDYNGGDYDIYKLPFQLFAIISAFILAFIFRKTKRENMIKYLKVISIVMIALEILKFSWESYWDIKTGRGLNLGSFNSAGILSLETCSMFMYVSAFAGYTKNEKVRRCCVGWLSTIGLAAGISNVVEPRGLKWYPVCTFGCLHSLFYHYILVLTALLFVFNRFYDFEFKDIIRAFIPHAIFSAFVIPLDYITKWDYMLYRDPSAFPLICNITDKLSDKGLYGINTVIVFVMFMFIDALFMCIYIGIYKLIDIIKNKNQKEIKAEAI